MAANTGGLNYRALMKDALVRIEELEAKLAAQERARREPIAIVGMGCRFPGGATTPDAYWELLRTGVYAGADVPSDRWDIDAYHDPDIEAPGKIYTRRGCFIPIADGFDTQFFGISAREAASMDPQQALLLEVSWEALENAHIPANSLYGSLSGVFLGISNFEHAGLLGASNPAAIDPYFGTGGAVSVASGRLSYSLGLKGPCVSVDTACSSSLVATHLACQSLRARECHLALACGVNLLQAPQVSITFCKARMLAPDGRCKTFDESADGFVRGEGCGVVVLKRLSDALAAGDRIVALIRGSAVNQDGPSGGLTVPSGPSQQSVIRQALASAGVQPDDVGYIEAHGTGTSLGDPIELGALSAVFGKSREGALLQVGSVKTNFGHLEGAAGIAGLIKVALSLEKGSIPPHLHLSAPTRHFPWKEGGIAVPTDYSPWPQTKHPRMAGVSSFGFSGTNAHVVLEQPPASPALPPPEPVAACALVLSGRTESALPELARRYAATLRAASVDFRAFCIAAATARQRFDHRLAVVAAHPEQAAALLDAAARGETPAGVSRGHARSGNLPRIAFHFAADDGRALGSEPPASRLTTWMERQFDAAATLRSWGIEAAAVSGTGEGEFTAAAYLGHLSLEAAIQAAALGEKPVASPPPEPSMDRWELSGSCDSRYLLDRAAHAHVAGTPVDWMKAMGGPARRQSLPNYPWRRKRVAASSSHPLLGKPVPGDSGILQFDSALSAASPVLLQDHRIFGEAVMPATAYLEMALTAAKSHSGGSAAGLEQVVYHEALVLSPDRKTDVRLTISEDDDGAAFRVASRDGDTWRLHSSGRLRSTVTAEPESLDVAQLHSRIPASVDVAGFYESFAARGIEFGPRFRTIDSLWSGSGEALARISLPALAARQPDGFQFHPVLLDACLQVLGAAFPEGGPKDVFLPVGVRSLVIHGSAPPRLWCHASLRPVTDPADPVRMSDLRLIADDGRIVATMERVESRRATREGLLRATVPPTRTISYAPAWQLDERNGTDAAASGHWIIYADRGGVGEALAGMLAERGATCRLCRQADGALPDANLPAGWGVVYLWPLDAAETPEPGHAECLRFLEFLQTLLDGAEPLPRSLFVVTRGALSVDAHPTPIRLSQAGLPGMASAAFLERPELGVCSVDLDEAPAWESARFLMEELTGAAAVRAAWRGGRRYTARLERCDLPQPAAAIRSDATYLITGGLGSLGLRVARRMVEGGARTVILAGRSQPAPEQQKVVRELREMGVNIVPLHADVASRETFTEALLHARRGLPPLRGVVHAAGVLDDATIPRQNAARFAYVQAPKVAGAWNLHRLTLHDELDFFVLFSSSAGLLGSAGQINYAAANSFLDAFAHYRHAAGLPALAIDWGPWSGGGMASRVAVRQQRAADRIDSREALDLFVALLACTRPQVAVLPGAWDVDRQEPAVAASIKVPASVSQWVHRAVADALGLAPPDVDAATPLEEMGFDSLMVVDLKARLASELGVQLRAEILVAGATVQGLAAEVESSIDAALRTPAPLSVEEQAPPAALPEDEEIPPSWYRFDRHPGYLEVKALLEKVRNSVADNPYFRVYDGVNGNTASSGGAARINYSSYNYLGLSGHAEVSRAAQQAIDRYGTSVSASRLISGERPVHGCLERGIAEFLGVEDCLVFVGGHSANESTIGHLCGAGDLIVHDALSHNSIVQGALLSGARRIPFPHNDAAELDRILRANRRSYRRVLILIEGVYSMDGDIADLPGFIEVKRRHKAFLMIDEAHSIGTLGPSGAGIGDHFAVDRAGVDIWMGTLSKSFASCGGYIAGSAALVQYLKFTTPGFVYSVGMPPAAAAAANAALEILRREPDRVNLLRQRGDLFLKLARERGLNAGLSQGAPVVPVIVGDSLKCLRLSQSLFERGIDVQPVLAPAVAEDGARLRFFLSSTHEEAQIHHTVATVADALRRLEQHASVA